MQKLTKKQAEWLIKQIIMKIFDENTYYSRIHETEEFWDKFALNRKQLNELISQCTEKEFLN